MPYLAACALVFLLAYGINILYVTVFYHRALTHSAVKLRPLVQKFVVQTGTWITGIDPKGWACMHRLHHIYSDTKQDPHSPVPNGIWSVLPLQLHSYQRILAGLTLGKTSYLKVVEDLEFPVNWVNRKQLWYLPYVLHLAIAIIIGVTFNAWLLALCYWVGIMSHPVQGWMVNALAHRFGYRNFDTADNSRNNIPVALLVFGEGYQNNHHQYGSRANFGVKWWEVDFGYWLCLGLAAFGVLTIPKSAKS